MEIKTLAELKAALDSEGKLDGRNVQIILDNDSSRLQVAWEELPEDEDSQEELYNEFSKIWKIPEDGNPRVLLEQALTLLGIKFDYC